MLKNQDFVESHKFEGRLKEFEQILIDFIISPYELLLLTI